MTAAAVPMTGAGAGMVGMGGGVSGLGPVWAPVWPRGPARRLRGSGRRVVRDPGPLSPGDGSLPGDEERRRRGDHRDSRRDRDDRSGQGDGKDVAAHLSPGHGPDGAAGRAGKAGRFCEQHRAPTRATSGRWESRPGSRPIRRCRLPLSSDMGASATVTRRPS